MPGSTLSSNPSRNTVEQSMVSIIDDSDDIRKSIARLLSTVDIQTQTYANAQSALAAVDQINTDRPGCVIIDLRLPDRDGMDLLHDLRSAGVNKPAIIITAYGDVPSAVRAMKAKVHDFLEKPFSDQHFIGAVQKALNCDARLMKAGYRRQQIQLKVDSLSKREQEVLIGIIQGRSSKAIALHLGLSQKTVENYRYRIMDKFEADNVVDLVTSVYDCFREQIESN